MSGSWLWGVTLFAFAFAGAMAWRVLGDMASDEVRGWLDIAPLAILRLAGARLNREQRDQLYYNEWLPELQFIMQEADTRPITRAIKATGFAFGLFMAARAVSRLRPPAPPPAVIDAVQMVSSEVTRMSPEDRKALAEFREYLATRQPGDVKDLPARRPGRRCQGLATQPPGALCEALRSPVAALDLAGIDLGEPPWPALPVDRADLRTAACMAAQASAGAGGVIRLAGAAGYSSSRRMISDRT